MDVVQTASFMQAITYEAGLLEYEDFPLTPHPVCILGTHYSTLHEMEELKQDFFSRMWFTYRKGFTPIGDASGPTSDAGWGCMLRCGQMMLAQALVSRHLGKDWRWCPGKYDPRYFEILRLFMDKKGSPYSIHQIASMGASEGKAVGEWFGPNTIAQVLKKLVVYDDWSNLVLHVALDNTVIIDDLRYLCTNEQSETNKCNQCKCGQQMAPPDTAKRRTTKDVHHGKLNGILDDDDDGAGCSSSSMECSCGCHSNQWRPLLLVIPLRLGLTDINPVYISSLKTCLSLPQSVGIIGGKPNHAHWFVGYFEDQMVFLDPHTIQGITDITLPDKDDESYHCEYMSRIKITQLDPSMALGFFCGTEKSFQDLCDRIRRDLIQRERTPMFELLQHRPPHWPSLETNPLEGATGGDDFDVLENRQYDTDEEFELL